MKQPFDVVLRELEQERECVDEDLRRLAVAAAHLRSLLPSRLAACHGGGAAPLGAR